MPEHNNYSNIDPSPCPEQCVGCERRTEGNTCLVYSFPLAKWNVGRSCPMATHLEKKEEEAKKVDPIKASKRAAKGK